MTREEAIKMNDKALSQEPISLNDINNALEASFRNGVRSAKVEQESCDVFDKYGNYKYPSDVELTEPNTATSMPCDDAISREKVMGLVAREHSEWDDLYIDIAKLPSVMQKSGKWIVDAPHYICSECNYVHHLQRLEVMSGCKLGNYCPNCGAKMESEDKE